MAKKNNNTPKNTPETDSNDLLNIFDETNKIDDIDQRIHITENQIIEKQNMLINKAIAEGNIKKAKELLDIFQQNIPKDNDEAKRTYRQLKSKINEKTVDQKLQEAITLYDTGSFVEAKTLLHEVSPITVEQESLREKYDILLKKKQKEIDIQQKNADTQHLLEMRKKFPNVLRSKSTEEIQTYLTTFESTFNSIAALWKDQKLIDQFEDFPLKEIYEVLQESYLQEDMTIFGAILKVNHPSCKSIYRAMAKNSTTTSDFLNISRKDIEKVLGIHKSFLGMGKTTADPFDKARVEQDMLSSRNIRDLDIFFDEIREKCINGTSWNEMDTRDRYICNKGKYINMRTNQSIWEISGMKKYIDKEGLDVSDMSQTKSYTGINELKQHLKGKQIISWKANDGSRWLEVID